MTAAGPIQKDSLDSRTAPSSRISRILSRRRRLDIVLAVHSEALDDLQGVLFMFVKGGATGLLKKPKKQRQSCRTVFTMCLFGGVQRPSICSAPLIIHIGS